MVVVLVFVEAILGVVVMVVEVIVVVGVLKPTS